MILKPISKIIIKQKIKKANLLKPSINEYSKIAFEDIKAMAYPILRHRLILNFDAMADNKNSEMIIKELINSVEQ